MVKEDSMQDEAVVIAEKLWQNSQSNHTKGQNLEVDLDAVTVAVEDNGWNRSRMET